MGMPLPGARSLPEIFLHIELNGCACGAPDRDDHDYALLELPGLLAMRREVTCSGCGRLRVFVFGIPDEDAYLRSLEGFGGPEPSELIDAGEWMFCGCVTAAGGDGDIAADMIDEVAKFIGPGADRPGDDAFDSIDGQRVRDAMPAAFRRSALADRARRYRAGRLVGDEDRVPAPRREYIDNRARNRLIAVLMGRFRSIVGSYIVDGPPEGAARHGGNAVLDPEVDLELVGLLGPGRGFDQLGTMLAAQLRWERFTLFPSGRGRGDLAEALRHYEALTGVDEFPVPAEVRTLLEHIDGR